MNNCSFNREQFNDTILKRLKYFIASGLSKAKRILYPLTGKRIQYPKPKKLI